MTTMMMVVMVMMMMVVMMVMMIMMTMMIMILTTIILMMTSVMKTPPSPPPLPPPNISLFHAGVYVYSACCKVSPKQLNCAVEDSALSDIKSGNKTSVGCSGSAILTGCNAVSANSKIGGVQITSEFPPRLPPRWPSGKAFASRAEDPGFESRLSRDFFGVESYQ